MPHESRAADLIGYSFLVMFAKDEVITAAELHFLERIALSDGEIDDEERAALRHIFARADYAHMEPAACAEIEVFRARYAV